MKKLTHWKCFNCKRLKKLPEEIERADMYAVCRSCKQGKDTHTSPDAAASEQAVYVHRRGIQRRMVEVL